ncbi:GNAT family N-acetyltransferase [Dokdonella fugitiva]|uniref:GNAT family N-acetyltransferase n=1 Tax=Dokdonella fugitiva TaxID=328517 RepID=UPI0015FCCBA5|nr:GNAT family N-acetyltransferase [Dokdonella fugitiva]MBA8883985.1 GNAT superfamily N-acetyltransferase [Dokdonella fugitiva]
MLPPSVPKTWNIVFPILNRAKSLRCCCPVCSEIFPGFDPTYLDRLKNVADPLLLFASHRDEVIGFKLGYRRGAHLFYSWLGGVRPVARRTGVAAALMRLQHERVAKLGYPFIETRARAANNPMIVLNLRSGFQIVGFEVDARAIPVVILRRALEPPT